LIAHIGCGYWGKNIAQTLSKLEILSGVHDFNDIVRKDFLQKYNLPEVDFETLLNDESIRGITIATPSDTHFEIAKKVLSCGKHVFIEKPISLKLDEAYNLKKIAEKNNLKIMVGHLMHYHDAFKSLKEHASKENIGVIKRIKSYRKSFGILRIDEDVIWSFAPHDISMALSLANGRNIKNLQCLKKSFFRKNTDSASISFDISDISVEIDIDWASSYKQQRFEVYGENGIIIFEDTNKDNEKLMIAKTQFNERVLAKKNILEFSPISYKKLNDPLTNEMLAFKKLILDSDDCYTDVDEAIDVLKVLEGLN
jgi:UDP-2-acetamido-3-amino-2,3-dideoxy-glucuronate N-acetyltransferase